VGVVQGRQSVAIYLPRDFHTLQRMACCVAVLNDHDLVIVSSRGNPEALLSLALQKAPARLHGQPPEKPSPPALN
jgi:hypothetical protein